MFTSSQHLHLRSPKRLAISMETVGWRAERRGYEGARCKRGAATSLERQKKKKKNLFFAAAVLAYFLFFMFNDGTAEKKKTEMDKLGVMSESEAVSR